MIPLHLAIILYSVAVIYSYRRQKDSRDTTVAIVNTVIIALNVLGILYRLVTPT